MRKTLQAKQQVQSRIEQAAVELFLEHGYRGTTVRAIAGRAGMTSGNIYFYYPCKEALFASIVEPARRELEELIQSGQRAMLQADRLSPSVIQDNYRKAASLFGRRRLSILVLFAAGAGTPYQGMYQELVDRMSACIYELALTWSGRRQGGGLKEPFFYRLLGLFWVEGFLEIVRGFRGEEWAERMLHDYVE
ncbi:MAG: TetR/AcrR family transcriptional regulator, partial [Spirochaetota bacterium]